MRGYHRVFSSRMSLEVQGHPVMEFGGVELEDLVLAGDDNSWAMEDWAWDSKAFTATPTAGAARAEKRHCSGLHLESSTACKGSLCDNEAGLCCGVDFPARDSKEEAPSEHSGSIVYREQEGAALDGKSPICQVEGCGRDLVCLSIYYQRCRICEVHIKESQFMRHGKLQRFCQQCGRCHELSAFQGSKRSCREQLAKHNARRRRRTQKNPDGAASESPSAIPASSPCQARLSDAFASLRAFFPGPQDGADHQEVPLSLGLPVESTNSFAPASFPAASLSVSLAGGFPPTSLPETGTMSLLCPAAEGKASHLVEAEQRGYSSSVAVGIPIPNATVAGAEIGGSSVVQGSSFERALSLLAPDSLAPQRHEYRSDNLVVRLSVKLFNCTPAELPADLKQQLTGWLKSTPAGAEGYLRPGCVHLTLQAHAAADCSQQITEEGLTALAAHLGGQHSRVWRERMVLLDLNGQVALMKDGQLVATWSFSPSGEKLAAWKPGSALETPPGVAVGAAPPKVTSASPTAVFLGRRGRTTVRLVGRGITCGDCKVVCRAGGAYRQVACQPFGPCCAAGEGHSDDADQEQSLVVELPGGLRPGLAWLEVHKGCLLSRPLPILVCLTAALAAELSTLRDALKQGYEELIADVGLLMTSSGSCAEAAPQLSATAVRLAEAACRKDLPELLRFLIDRFKEGFSGAKGGELSLMHVAVQNGSTHVLPNLLKIDSGLAVHPGPQGITPLHLAAIRGDSSLPVRLLLSQRSPAAWLDCLTDDGLSPSDFAQRAGRHALDSEMLALCQRTDLGHSESGADAILQGAEARGGDAGEVCVVEIGRDDLMVGTESSGGAAEPLLGKAGVSEAFGTCMTWEGPLAGIIPRGLPGRWSNVALLGVVACLCTCVVLLRDWAGRNFTQPT